MSAAAAKPLIILPQIAERSRQRAWAVIAVILVDVLAVQLSLAVAAAVRPGFDATQYESLAFGALALPVAFYLAGLYPGYGISAVDRIRIRFSSTLAVFLILFVASCVVNSHQWSRGVVGVSSIVALVLGPLFENHFRKALTRRGILGLPVVIIGAGRTGMSIARTLLREADLGFRPIGFLDDDSRRWGTTIEDLPVIGPLSAAPAISNRAKLALVTIPPIYTKSLSFDQLISVPDLFAVQSLWIASCAKDLTRSRLLKRLVDYAVSLPLLLLSVPLVTILAFWVKAVSPGPVLFRQQRGGAGGKRITVYKLRTMFPDAERILNAYLDSRPDEKRTWNRFYKLKHDPRIIPGIGHFLRRYSLDELPQLWNVIRGEMSLVGPRPYPYYHLESFPASFRDLRSTVLPGVTGLWQVSDRSDGDISTQEVDDTCYIRNWSFWLDLYILMRTPESVITAKGAY